MPNFLELYDSIVSCKKCDPLGFCWKSKDIFLTKDRGVRIEAGNPIGVMLVGTDLRKGEFLDNFLKDIGLIYDNCWITNVTKCYIYNKRIPFWAEIIACSDYLKAEIELVKPKLIVAIGNEAIRLFIGKMGVDAKEYYGEVLRHPRGFLGPVESWVVLCQSFEDAVSIRKLKDFLNAHAIKPQIQDFDGETFEQDKDGVRLGNLLNSVKSLMLDGCWRTLSEIKDILGKGSEAGISARLRDLRKDKFGAYQVSRRIRGDSKNGLWEYTVVRKEGMF